MRLALGCLLLALPALAQLDSATLRAKFGAPLNRETFHMPQGFDLTVDYGAGNQVCKLAVPAEMPPQPDVSGPFNATATDAGFSRRFSTGFHARQRAQPGHDVQWRLVVGLR